jgi:hypothetical protein
MIIYYKDKDNDKAADLFKNISNKNPKLYDFITQNLRSDDAIGIRLDVLEYISVNAESFGSDQTYLFNLASFTLNLKAGVEHIKWLNEYFSVDDPPMGIEDFLIGFTEAVEKDIPLAEIKKLFGNDTDILSVFNKIQAFDPELSGSSSSCEHDVSPTEEVADGNNSRAELGYTEIFDNMVTVMSVKNDSDTEVKDINDNLASIISKFQESVSLLSAYSSDIVHEIENDKDEIKRLTALLSLQRTMLSSQQYKINEMRGEIAVLNNKLQMAEKKEIHREAINRKISELQSLTFSEQKDNEALITY